MRRALRSKMPACESADLCQTREAEEEVDPRVLIHCEDGISHCIPVFIAYVVTEIPQTCDVRGMLEVFRRSVRDVAVNVEKLKPWVEPLLTFYDGVMRRELKKRDREFKALRLSSLAGL